ncbi:DndE family protein [Apibacter adventoris]|uniref:DNA sulfur modification protein DndE n=1 Tax=Apibacter adventoris TaxID=1679466 RepID=A0A2S8A7R7_9FLAO|nr:DndE family protein [Apibacter adventoris]PQL90536.1 DNA sulfur modification protein DndE [Apibacter adventoris]
MQFNIKTSSELVKKLTNKMGLGEENHIARISIAYSLAKGATYNSEKLYNSTDKQKEYKDNTLFGSYKDYYVSLICQKYQIHKDDADVRIYLKWHIDKGLEMINLYFNENKNVSGIEFLLDHIELGIDAINENETSFDFVKNKNNFLKEKESYLAPIKILIGEYHGKDIYFTPNNTSIYGNCHVAIAGQSGTGKSYFARKFLERIIAESKGQVNFLYLDFKGMTESDKTNKDYKDFFSSTNAKLIDTPKDSFPVNPLSFINNVNEKDKIVGIGRFVDIIVKYANLGNVQKQHLKDATRKAFEDKKDGSYPTLSEILENVYEIAGDKPTSLTQILIGLTEIDLFDNNKLGDFINENYYLSLSGDLSKEVRFTATFLVIYYLYNIFMNMDKVSIDDNYSGLRYVLLIDEAHNVFKEKKSQEILEKLLREVRSQGVAVMLVSQGVEEFNQPTFDFSEMCQSAFLMQIKDGNNWKSTSKFLGAGEKQRNKINRSMEAINPRQAISNIKEFEFGEIFNIK